MGVRVESSGVVLFRPNPPVIDADEAEILADADLMDVIEERLADGADGAVDIDEFIAGLDSEPLT